MQCDRIGSASEKNKVPVPVFYEKTVKIIK
ncbi:hypothetical protein SATMO3_08200 [Sporomusa aerivorans]